MEWHQPFGSGTSRWICRRLFFWGGSVSQRRASSPFSGTRQPGSGGPEGEGHQLEDCSLVNFSFYPFASPSLLYLGFQSCIFLPFMCPVSCVLAGQCTAVWDGSWPLTTLLKDLRPVPCGQPWTGTLSTTESEVQIWGLNLFVITIPYSGPEPQHSLPCLAACLVFTDIFHVLLLPLLFSFQWLHC